MVRVGHVSAALVFAALASGLSSVAALPWRVPLERRPTSRGGQAMRATAQLFATDPAPSSSVWTPTFPGADVGVATTRSSVPIDFHLLDDGLLFAATVSLGTPPQQVSLSLNWLASDTLVLNHAVPGHAYYDHTLSSAYQANGTRVRLNEDTPYEIQGFVSQDHVTIGDPSGDDRLEVRDHMLVEMASPDSVLQSFPRGDDGDIGIAPGRANTTGTPSLVREMIDQGLLERPEIGVSYSESEAHILFGGTDPKYSRSAFHYYGGQRAGRWSVPIREVLVKGRVAIEGAVGGVFWDFAPFVAGPINAVKLLAAAVGADKTGVIPCKGASRDIVFRLDDGLEIRLTKKEYAKEIQPNVCWFMFRGFDVDSWILGLPFLQSVYAVLDYGNADGHERIGVAPIHHN